MFTGIVQGCGTVHSVATNGEITTLGIELPSTTGLEVGGSVAIDGVCLTATSVGEIVSFDLIPETLERTTLGNLGVGSEVNVERAMRMGDELGGHLLSGHVMTTAEIQSISNQDYRISAPPHVAEFIHEKGFIAVDGISLTIGETDGNGCFDVHIIPETLRLTTIGSKGVGTMVNIEIDAMTQAVVETVKRMMASKEV
jgi:riboflavin synthase